MRYTIVLMLWILILGACQTEKPAKPTLVMFSMDGFRWDYTEDVATPTLDSIAKNGVKAVSMIPSFPTKTFPNHYSLATGLYPDEHGIVLNGFYDDSLKRGYKLSDRDAVGDGVFYGGEPIWNTVEKQGGSAATFFWVGSEADVENRRPTRWKNFDSSIGFEARADSVLSWLALPERDRPDLIMWYVEEPDHVGHVFGPEATETRDMVAQLDELLGDFFQQVQQNPDHESFNFIITSDHGMGKIDTSRALFLVDYIDTSLTRWIDGWNPNFNLKVKEGQLEAVMEQLSQMPHIQYWKNEEIPQRLHYGKNQRTHDITLVAEPEWSVYLEPGRASNGGNHGYDNAWEDMHTIFYAIGPAFKHGYSQEAFPNVDVYEIACKVLQLRPADNSGDISRVKGMFAD